MGRGTITWKPARNGWEVQISLGSDPVTGKRRRPTKLVPGENTPASRNDAERVLTQMLANADAQTLNDSSAPIGQVLEQWYTTGLRTWSPTTAAGYRQIIDSRLLKRWGKTRLRDLRRADLMAWHDELFAAGRSLPRVRRVHAVLRRALNHAVERELLAVNVAAGGKMLPTERRPDVAPPSPEELDRVMALIDEADPNLGAFIRVASWCGMRRSEMCGLLWADVDFDQAEIRVHRAVVQIGRNLYEKDTKTHQQRRISMGPETMAVLRAHRDRFLVEGRIGARSYVWTRSDLDGAKPWAPDTVTAAWSRHRTAAGVTCRLHDLRHYMATQVLDAGESISTVQARLGHSKASTTLDIYAHAIKARDEDAAAAIERLSKRSA